MPWHLTPAAQSLIARITVSPALDRVQAVAPMRTFLAKGDTHVVTFIANARGQHHAAASQLRDDLDQLHSLRDAHVAEAMGGTFLECEARGGRDAAREWVDAHNATLTPDEAIEAALGLVPVERLSETRIAA